MKLSRLSPAILALVLSSLCLVVAAQVGLPVGILRAPAGVVAALFAPGYATLMVIRPRRLAYTSRLLLSVPLSVSIVIAIGVCLDLTPFGIHPGLMTLGLSCVSIALIVVGWWRAKPKHSRSQPLPVRRRVTAVKKVHLPAIAALLAIIVGIAVWAKQGIVRASRDTAAPFSELFLSAVAVAEPKSTAHTPASIHLGVKNHENRAMNYVLRVLVHSTGRATTLVYRKEFRIASDKSWGGAIHAGVSCGDDIEAQVWLPRRLKPDLRVQAQPVCMSSARNGQVQNRGTRQ